MGILLFFIVFALSSLLVLYTAIDKTNISITALLAGSLVYLSRILPNRPPTMQWWGDHHFYFWVTKGVVEGGSLTLPADFITIYPQAQRQATWFSLHVISAFIVQISGLASLDPALRYLAPILGPVTLFVLWYFYSQFLSRGWSLAAAYTTCMLDLVVFYQTQFHEQGMGIVAGVFFLAVMVWLWNKSRVGTKDKLIGVLSLLALSTSHHMTSLTIASTYVVFYTVSSILNKYYNKVPSAYSSRSRLYLFLLGIVIPTVYLWGAVNTVATSITQFVTLVKFGELSSGGDNNFRAATAEYQPTIVSELVSHSSLFIKILLVILSGYSVFLALRDKFESKERQLLILTIGFGASAVLVFPIHRVAIVRMTIFGYVGLVGLSFLTFSHIADKKINILLLNRLKLVASILFAIMIAVSLLSAYPPSLIDASADISPDSYTGIKPMGAQGPASATWLGLYAKDDVSYRFAGKLRGVLFYYGEVPVRDLVSSSKSSESGYGVYDIERNRPVSSDNAIFSNGRVIIVDY